MKMRKRRKAYQLKKRTKRNIKISVLRRLINVSLDPPFETSLLIPILKKGDKLMEDGDTLLLNGTDELIMAEGFAQVSIAMLRMAQFIGKREVAEQLAIPALFCFRQYVELMLKDALLTIPSFVMSEISNIHSLWNLWQKLVNRLPETERKFSTDSDKVAISLLKNLNDIDQCGMRFRYSAMPDGTPFEPIGHTDLSFIIERACQLHRFIDSVNDWAYQIKDSYNNKQ